MTSKEFEVAASAIDSYKALTTKCTVDLEKPAPSKSAPVFSVANSVNIEDSTELKTAETNISAVTSKDSDLSTSAVAARCMLAPKSVVNMQSSEDSIDIPTNESSRFQYNGNIHSISQARGDASDTLQFEPSAEVKERCRTISVVEGDGAEKVPTQTKRKRTESYGIETSQASPDLQKLNLLSHPKDKEILSPLHVFIREQIEVFTATREEMSQPAPGRKNPIRVKQVGLRCIHCRDLPISDRVKRAVCYPSNVGRVYNSVSDMKFDHFPNCRGLSEAVKAKFNELKLLTKTKAHKKSSSKTTGCSSSTAQYYHDAAQQMGMVNGTGGVFLKSDGCTEISDAQPVLTEKFSDGASRNPSCEMTAIVTPAPSYKETAQVPVLPRIPCPPTIWSTHIDSQSHYGLSLNLFQRQNMLSRMPSSGSVNMGIEFNIQPNVQAVDIAKKDDGIYILASTDDSKHLNPIHCFVRRHVEFFAAEKDDIAAPAPGRKNPVILGQVGVRCIHCSRIPPKDRVKRAVCYPASVSGIYHSVSNMKFDHFSKCKALPESQRALFMQLREACQRRGKDGSGGKDPSQGFKKPGIANSTAQYYHDSAIRMGLVDSNSGIRFWKNTAQSNEMKNKVEEENTGRTPQQQRYLPVPDGMSALMIAANFRSRTSPSAA